MQRYLFVVSLHQFAPGWQRVWVNTTFFTMCQIYCNNIVQVPARHCVVSHTTKGKENEKSGRQAGTQQAQGGVRQPTFKFNFYLFSHTHTLFHTFTTLGSSGTKQHLSNINV